MVPRFDLFVIFAEMRTGSNLLEANLNSIPGVTCHGEAFNPRFPGYPDLTELLGTSLRAREADPMALLARIRARPGLNGFRYFHDHDPRILDALIGDPRCAKVVLTRNPMESYVSLKIARQTGQWKLGDARHQRRGQVIFDADEFRDHLQGLQDFQLRLLRGLQAAGQTAFYLDYEDLQDLSVLNGLAAFLGVEGRVEDQPAGLVKQNPEPLEEKVANLPAMEAALATLDRFNLARTPNFEPRRGPAVPGFLAARGAPALFMPVKAGPVERVADWLGRLGGAEGGVDEGFTQKTLRQWLRDRPGHRGFTVLSHPAVRAHRAFCDYVLNGRYAEIRDQLRRTYKLPLPAPAKVAAMDLTAHRAAFLGFARFLKGNLAGQTAVRIDGAWASQSAVLHGFAQFAAPDLIAREETLERDLGHLAAMLGRDSPPLAPPGSTGPFPLAEVMTDEIAAALREAYARDHAAFGYGEWRG
ncbi:nodulation protein NodH [Frigidibacter oleivorans]|uniref:nodulation protein NodH n=1 Tax=Frigidibacter oleivorans TaxID=2487129 RepID=UPI000F8F7AC9|nr:nodulation protein NodH [Frigidibacter oleivorans]